MPHEYGAAAVAADPTVAMAHEVAAGLERRPRQIPARYFYDALGSRLFDAICALPWYHITRAETGLLAAHAPVILSADADCSTVVELGGGDGAKLSVLLGASGGRPLDVHLVDVSLEALTMARRRLSALDAVALRIHEADYETGLAAALGQRGRRGRALVLLLGSNIGNLVPDEAAAFLRAVRAACRPGDRLLLGADLVKPEAELLLAYDDPLGVTAAFNKNMLLRLNRDLDADFDLQAFDHRVEWNAAASRVEMYLESRVDQLVCIRDAGCCIRLDAGERIQTENSCKYEPEQVVALGGAAGFAALEQWIAPDARFALTLLECEP